MLGVQFDPLIALTDFDWSFAKYNVRGIHFQKCFSSDFEITRMISDQIELHSVQLPL